MCVCVCGLYYFNLRKSEQETGNWKLETEDGNRITDEKAETRGKWDDVGQKKVEGVYVRLEARRGGARGR